MQTTKLIFVSFLTFSSVSTFSQVITDSINSVPPPPPAGNTLSIPGTETAVPAKTRKGELFFYWGYNRSAYTKSDIRFWGDGYDFTITDIEAKDEPTKEFITYIKPNSFTIPEYNYRLGYFISDKYYISLGEDHMKYAIEKQATKLSGSITIGENQGDYDNADVLVGEEAEMEEGETSDPGLDTLPHGFVSGFEHCDGLNDVSLELGRIEQIWSSSNGNQALTLIGTVATGMVIPDTEAEVLEQRPYHSWDKKTYHLAGFSFSAGIGVQFDFCRHFFLMSRVKAGYINLPDIRTTIYKGKASQQFGFVEPMLVAGYRWTLGKK